MFTKNVTITTADKGTLTFAAAPTDPCLCICILYRQGAIGEAKFIRTLRQIENEAIQAPSAKAGATPLSEEVKSRAVQARIKPY